MNASVSLPPYQKCSLADWSHLLQHLLRKC